ncbi:MAG: DUF5106 domain-containing protein, partial [Bacteroidales bacterium]|nr:DUF5106 domain-containing protein [Bacteroidales bacterium]
MRFVCFITVLVLFNRIYAQDYSIKAGFRDLPFKSVYLAEMEGEKYKIIDSVTTNFMGNFTFKIKKNQHIGQYRLLTLPEKKSKSQEKKIILDFLFNKENIEFLTDSQAPTDSMRDVKSVENEIYFQYVKLRNDNKYKADVLKHFLTNYPKDDDFYIKANEKYSQLQVEINQYIDKVIKKEPKTYIARMLKMEKNILPDTKLGEEQQNEYLKIHYFDGFDFNDTSLVYSNAITNKIVGYLGLFREKPYNRDKQEIAFIRAVDNIMKATKQNKKVYEFILDYII